MRRKSIPLIFMLLAGAVTSILTYVLGYEIRNMLWTLLIVLVVFFVFGLVVKGIFDFFEKQNKKREQERAMSLLQEELSEEGAVIEKEIEA